MPPNPHFGASEAAVRVGCAGWSLSRSAWPQFPATGSHLERYAAHLDAVEINSSFYRPHQNATYARWAQSVPEHFRFSVKLPKAVTHRQRLAGCGPLLDAFLAQVAGLGQKLGCLLIQLPPTLAYDPFLADSFLGALRDRHDGPMALEPRHPGWFGERADAALVRWRVARVLADPVLCEAGRRPGGDPALVYLRLHGSPRRYYSAYEPAVLDALAVRMQLAAASDASVWCIFDNTASGAAVGDALYTLEKVARP